MNRIENISDLNQIKISIKSTFSMKEINYFFNSRQTHSKLYEQKMCEMSCFQMFRSLLYDFCYFCAVQLLSKENIHKVSEYYSCHNKYLWHFSFIFKLWQCQKNCDVEIQKLLMSRRIKFVHLCACKGQIPVEKQSTIR